MNFELISKVVSLLRLKWKQNNFNTTILVILMEISVTLPSLLSILILVVGLLENNLMGTEEKTPHDVIMSV